MLAALAVLRLTTVLPVIVQGVMRLHTDQFDGSWTPVFHAAQHRKGSEEFWPVGLSMRQLCCVVCKEVPQVRSWAATTEVGGWSRHSLTAGGVPQVARYTLVAYWELRKACPQGKPCLHL